jgi:hypothetical protein
VIIAARLQVKGASRIRDGTNLAIGYLHELAIAFHQSMNRRYAKATTVPSAISNCGSRGASTHQARLRACPNLTENFKEICWPRERVRVPFEERRAEGKERMSCYA